MKKNGKNPVSIVVVCYNEKENIRACLDGLLQQTYPHCEILCVDNGSDDGTRDILEKMCREHKQVRTIVNPVLGIAGSRNMGLRAARYDLLAFIDADCWAPPDWLEKLIDGYRAHSGPKLAGVGGANVPPDNGRRFYKLLRIFMNTYLGSHGSVQGVNYRQDKMVPHLPTVNVLYCRDILLQTGGFDNTFGNIGEDQDLSYRLTGRGFKLYYIAGAFVVHKLRPDFRSWCKNMFVYGKGRTWLMRKHPARIKIPLLLPAALTAMHLVWMVYRPALVFLFYYPMVLLYSFFQGQKAGRPELFLQLFGLYVGSHLCYGCGQWYGLFKRRTGIEK